MKMIVAIIKPSRLDAVLDAVTEAGASGLTVTGRRPCFVQLEKKMSANRLEMTASKP